MIKKFRSAFTVATFVLAVTSQLFSQPQYNPFTSIKASSTKKTLLSIKEDEKRLCWDDSVNNHSIGLVQGGEFTAAVRFDADTISHYQNYKVTKLAIYVADIPTSASLQIFQGENQTNMVQHYNQSFTPQADSWNEIELNDPYIIDSSLELWFGVRFDGIAGIEPAGTDTLTNAPGLGNMVKIGENDWTTLSTYQIKGDWNIQAIIDTIVVEGFTVTFNVDMTGALFGTESETFNPRTHQVFISGSFNNWMVPGSDETYKLNLVYPDLGEGELPTTLSESWEDYTEFTTELSPWTTIMVNDSITWHFSDFNFPGEGTPFSFMVFNPDSTSSAITENFPAKSGEKYLVAVQSQRPNDDKWLISPQLKGTEITALSFWARSMTHAYGAERFQVLISTVNPVIDDFVMISDGDFIEAPLEWTEFEFDLSQYNGQPFYFAIRYVSEDAIMLMIDDIVVSGERPLPDEWIHTVTLNLDEGLVEYKYSVVIDTPTSEFGEWEGDEGRMFNAVYNRTLDDIWGIPSATDPIENGTSAISLYPNPTSDILYIEHKSLIEAIRVFDIAGRVVYSSLSINSTTHKLDVNNFGKGIYILQLVTHEGLKSKKFVVGG